MGKGFGTAPGCGGGGPPEESIALVGVGADGGEYKWAA